MSGDPKIGSWREFLEKTVELGLGAALLTADSVKKVVDDLVKRGGMSKEEGQKLAAQLLERGKAQKERMERLVAETVERVLSRTDVARRSQLAELERRMAELEEEIGRLRAAQDATTHHG
jgi:polyhydroxyalkanoate synthesis regulator phasin